MRGTALVLGLVLSSCAQPPGREVDIAAERVARAQEEDASRYAGATFQEAEEALARAREGLSDPRRYRDAIRAAAVACIRADEAREHAVQEKRGIARSAGRLLRESDALMDEARSLGAETGRGAELESLDARYHAIQSSLEKGLVSEAYESAVLLKKDLLGLVKGLKKNKHRPGAAASR